jgi:hypothetical protein
MRPINEDDWQFLPVPIALAGPACGFVQVMSQRWWLVCPKRGLQFYNPIDAGGRRMTKGFGSPQCNMNLSVVRRLQKKGYEIQYFERVFVPINLMDYA